MFVSSIAWTAPTLGVPVITGAVRGSRAADARLYRSSVLWIAPKEGLVASLDKVRAVPLVESARAPLGAGLLTQAFGSAARFRKVEEADAAQALHGGFSVSPVLCYEALFPALVAARRDADSVAILNLADDSWVSGERATRQLTAFSAFRAIEQRLPLVRVAHGGLSAVIDEWGETRLELPLDRYAWRLIELAPHTPPTWVERALLMALPLTAGLGVWWAAARWERRRNCRRNRRWGLTGRPWSSR